MFTYPVGLYQSESWPSYTVPTAWLVGEYLFDGNANETSGTWGNGTATNITWTTVWSVQVADFTATSSKISLPYNVARRFDPSVDDYSFSFFIKNDDLTLPVHKIINNTNDSGTEWYSIYIDAWTGGIRAWIYTWSTFYLSAIETIVESEREYITINVEWWVEFTMYIDNVLVDTVSISGISSFSNTEWFLLGNNESNIRYLDGQMARVRIYDQLLTYDDRTNLYNEGVDLLWL